MRLIEDLNSERFLNEAFNPEHNKQLLQAALLRRNVYLAFFLTGIACIFITALSGQVLLSFLSVGLATLSLVIMTKYNTQVFFLNVVELRVEEEEKSEAV
jgi:uncharacterized membrane protein YjjP (DUF1212 family)